METRTVTATTAIDPAIVTATDVPLADARFISLVTYRRTGEPVATPVLFAFDGDRLLVRTAHDAGKLKRLAHTSRVSVAPCDQRGRVLGPAVSGEARVLVRRGRRAGPGQAPRPVPDRRPAVHDAATPARQA